MLVIISNILGTEQNLSTGVWTFLSPVRSGCGHFLMHQSVRQGWRMQGILNPTQRGAIMARHCFHQPAFPFGRRMLSILLLNSLVQTDSHGYFCVADIWWTVADSCVYQDTLSATWLRTLADTSSSLGPVCRWLMTYKLIAVALSTKHVRYIDCYRYLHLFRSLA